MLKVNNKIIEVKHFPDNTQMLLDVNLRENDWHTALITWYYENDEECMTLWYLVHHLREHSAARDIILNVAYIPNARMDRTHSEKEIFTLKYFADFINNLNFKEVWVFDAHSNVSLALINNVRQYNVESILKKVITKVTEDTVIYFPDSGSMKRYKELDIFKNKTIIYGQKNRDWDTGKILGIEIYNQNGVRVKSFDECFSTDPYDFTNPFNGKAVLMIDDIISYGGTLAYSADKLHELGAAEIFAYASHVENSVLDSEKGTLLQRLNTDIVSKIYTTNSIYNGEHEDIEIIAEF